MTEDRFQPSDVSREQAEVGGRGVRFVSRVLGAGTRRTAADDSTGSENEGIDKVVTLDAVTVAVESSGSQANRCIQVCRREWILQAARARPELVRILCH